MKAWPFGDLTPAKYGALLIDFPLHYQMRSEEGYGRSSEAHYATMTEAELSELPTAALAAPDCMAWVWSTWAHLPMVTRIMRRQGWTWKTGGAWTKLYMSGNPAVGTGFILRGVTEPWGIFTLGCPRVGSHSVRNHIETVEWVDEDEFPSLIKALRREHSRKPAEAREMLRALRPDCHIAELFAREPWDGCDVWGNQTDKFSEVAA